MKLPSQGLLTIFLLPEVVFINLLLGADFANTMNLTLE